MTIIAHLVLWALMIPILSGFLYRFGPPTDDDRVVWIAGTVLSSMLIGIPISLVCVVRFWWG